MTLETRVWLAQCLCPQRHCIMAAAAEAGTEEVAREAALEPLRMAIEAALCSFKLNPWCGICEAPAQQWTFEIGRTPYHSLAEAKAPLEEEERKQRATAAVFGDMKRGD